MMHRALRLSAFFIGLAVGGAAVVFGYSNDRLITVHWWRWEIGGVHVFLLTVIPLLVGVVVGYLYHLPARMFHFTEHMRHLGRAHELEHENKDLRKTLDRLMDIPDDRESVLTPPPAPEPVLLHEVSHPIAPAREEVDELDQASEAVERSVSAAAKVSVELPEPAPRNGNRRARRSVKRAQASSAE